MASYWNLVESAGRIAHIERLRRIPATARIYTKADGSIYQAGEILKNPDMGRTYRRIADQGVADFYEGAIASEIVADMKLHGALLGKEDLHQYKTWNCAPLSGRYCDYEIATTQLPGGGAMVLEMLNILSHFDLKAMGGGHSRAVQQDDVTCMPLIVENYRLLSQIKVHPFVQRRK